MEKHLTLEKDQLTSESWHDSPVLQSSLPLFDIHGCLTERLVAVLAHSQGSHQSLLCMRYFAPNVY